jgi:hypothetical protein
LRDPAAPPKCQRRLARSRGIETVAYNVKAYALPLYFAALKFD